MIAGNTDAAFERRIAGRVDQVSGDLAAVAAAERHVALDDLIVEFHLDIGDVSVAEVGGERREAIFVAERNRLHVVVAVLVGCRLPDHRNQPTPGVHLQQVHGDVRRRRAVPVEDRAGHGTVRCQNERDRDRFAGADEIHIGGRRGLQLVAHRDDLTRPERDVAERERSVGRRLGQAQTTADARACDRVQFRIEHDAGHRTESAFEDDGERRRAVGGKLRHRVASLQRRLVEALHVQGPGGDRRKFECAIGVGLAHGNGAFVGAAVSADHARLTIVLVVDDDGETGRRRVIGTHDMSGQRTGLHVDPFRAVGRQQDQIAFGRRAGERNHFARRHLRLRLHVDRFNQNVADWNAGNGKGATGIRRGGHDKARIGQAGHAHCCVFQRLV